MPRSLRVINLTSQLTRYTEGLRLQSAIAQERKQGIVDDTLLLLQHHHVYTLGKRGKPADFRRPKEELEASGVDICIVPRGGEVTYHGPGQLVAYPIVAVRQAGLGARAFVESLEDSIVDCLALYGIAARGRVPAATGVWVGERKIAAIGVQISGGVSTHGLALNVDTDLSYFANIVPCGIPDKEVTSVRLEAEARSPGIGAEARAGARAGAGAGVGTGGATACGHTGTGAPGLARVAADFEMVFRSRLGYGGALG